MVGTALRNYAEMHGLSCSGDCVYGRINRHYIALLDGIGVKILQIYLCPPGRDDKCAEEYAYAVLKSVDPRTYRLVRQNAVSAADGCAVVLFQDGRGAMARVGRYIDEVMPRLDSIAPGDACACCGGALGEGVSFVRVEGGVLPVHEGCVENIASLQARCCATPEEGSAVRGMLGALLGAALSVPVWIVLQMLGFVTGVAGFLTGFLANLLYGWMGGRRGRVRMTAVLLALLLGVIAGQTAGTSALYAGDYSELGGRAATGLTCPEYVLSCWEECIFSDQTEALGRRYDRMLNNIPEAKRDALAGRDEYIRSAWDSEYAGNCAEARLDLLSNLGMGVLFGLIGCIGLFSQLRREKVRRTVRVLK